jgi:outer membrane lipoprotein-sorting protein
VGGVASVVRRLLVLAIAAAGLSGAAAPSASAPPDAATILQRSEARWQGMTSYQAPVTISGSVRAFIISVPVHMTGTQYYQAPDQQALHLNNPPSYARGLGSTLSAIGTPQTWLRDYAIASPVTQPHGHHMAYVLTGTPKRQGRVKTVTMSISATTYAIESMAFSYTNGATLVVTYVRHHGATQYHLPRQATVQAKFPAYSGNATITYGDYTLNQPIPATVFEQH